MRLEKHQMVMLGLAGALCMGTSVSAVAGGAMSDRERFQQQKGSEMGVPEPGSVSDQETTRKKRNPTDTPESTGQTTLGGAQYFVEGEVLNIDGDYYTLKKGETGEQVRLIVNRDTNLDCAAMPSREGSKKKSEATTSERFPAEKQAPHASEQQIEQGQRKDETARGAGFRIGE